MSELDEVVSELMQEENNSKIGAIQINKVKQWMSSKDIEVLGAVYSFLIKEKHRTRIKPGLSQGEVEAFCLNYLVRCVNEDPEGEWSKPSYIAGGELVRWFVDLWKRKNSPKAILTEMKNKIAKVYIDGDKKIKDCITLGVLEHLFEIEGIQKYFFDWEKDSILKIPYDEAVENAKGFKDIGGSSAV